jgi:hypothetical protein
MNPFWRPPVSRRDFLSRVGMGMPGFDHERQTYPHAGRDFRLTDVSSNVNNEIVARRIASPFPSSSSQ